MARSSLLPFLFAILALALGCGSGTSRQVQSLTVSPASVTATNGAAQFSAMGVFNTMPTSGTARAAWIQIPPAYDPPSSPVPLTISDQPFTAQCMMVPPQPVTVFAISPVDANAPADTSMSLSTLHALVLDHTATQSGGFIVATAHMNCP
jgi:hypothetical protein